MLTPQAETGLSGEQEATAQTTRGPLALAALGYALFLVYGSLVPMHLQPLSLAQGWQAFLDLPGPGWRDGERVDLAVNFLLTVPLAFLLAHLARTSVGAMSRMLGWLLVGPAVALLSLGVEFAQVFFPPRDPSWTDVVAQWAGAVAGLGLQALLGPAFARLLARLAQRDSARTRGHAWLALYLALMLAFSLMPLDLSLSPVELYRKWRDGRVLLVPFSGPWPGGLEFAYELLTDVLVWVPVGLLWRVDGSGRGLREVVLRVLLAAAAIELAQLPVLSRVSDLTDVLTAALGGALGAVLPAGLDAVKAWTPARREAWLGRLWWVWLAVAVLALWLPLNFALPAEGLGAALAGLLRMPFQTYFYQGEFHALNEILRKLLLFLPGGLLVGARALLATPGARRGPGLGTMWALAFGLEAGQLFLPTKVADFTDAVLGGLGAVLGARIAASLAGAVSEPAPVTPASASALAPVPAAPSVVRAPGWGWQAGLLLGLMALAWTAGHLPGLPYNLAKLFPAGLEGLLSAAGLAAFLGWLLAAPLWLLAPPRRHWRLLAGLLLPLHALVAFLLLRATVPLAMLYKVIGNPVLDWGGPWEDLLRYLALHACLVLPVLGAALLVRVLQAPRTLADFIAWALTALLLFWPLHWAVVVQAGTDNLVELMRGGGSLGASAALGTAWLLVATAGSALAAALVPGRRRVRLWLLAAAALALAPVLFAAGLEPVLVKYGRSFSALQFIVSAGRDRYATGGDLVLRAALALAAATVLVALLQALPWRALAAADAAGSAPPAGARRRRRHRTPPA